MIKELISIANELDQRSLRKEADYLDGLINNAEDPSDWDAEEELRPLVEHDLSPQDRSKIKQFIMWNLLEDAPVDTDPYQPLSDILHNDSQELKTHMQEVMPEKVSMLAEMLGKDANDVKDLILEQARELSMYEPGNGESSDFTYAVDAMNFYLSDYIF
jgi:hypothetical protein